MRSYRSVCTERASCCGAFRSWTFPSLLTHCQPPCSSSIIFAVAGGRCVLILSVLGEGYWSVFVDFVVAVKAEGRLGNLRILTVAPGGARCQEQASAEALRARASPKFITSTCPAAERNIKSGFKDDHLQNCCHRSHAESRKEISCDAPTLHARARHDDLFSGVGYV